MMIPVVQVNYLAVLVAGLVTMPIGALWYSNVLFAKPWSAAVGKTSEQMRGGAAIYVLALVGELIAAYVLAHFITYAAADTLVKGLQTGFWAWLGFVVPAVGVDALFAGRGRNLFAINAGYHLANLLVMGAILAVWT
jgi:hypothetical protein